jgi:pimeloyl-ACP methyl ester carboxylesterase
VAQFVFSLPDLGEGLVEAELVSWLVVVGDTVERDAPIAEVDTAKATVELPSPVAGSVIALHAAPGARVVVGAPLVTFEVGDRPGIVGTIPHGEAPTRRVRLRLPEGAGASDTAVGSAPAINIVTSASSEEVPVLLVHGLAGSHAAWAVTGWTTALERAGRAWVALDLRGHGKSEKPHDPAVYRADLLAEDLRHTLDSVGAEQADLLGFSLGAELALEFALTYPGRVRRLVLGGIGRQRPVSAEAARGVLQHVTEGRPLPEGLAVSLWQEVESVPGNDLVALAACLVGVSSSEPLEDLGRYPGPTLVFAGTEDAVAADVEQLRAELADGDLLAIEGAGHLASLGSRIARDRGIAFLTSGRETR